MSTAELTLVPPPDDPRRRELWLQHAAGLVLFEDVRGYALGRLDPGLSDEARQAARKAIDDALYGVMLVIDGVTGGLSGGDLRFELHVAARLLRQIRGKREVVEELDLADGDGMCMGFHGWLEGDFGPEPVATRPPLEPPKKAPNRRRRA